MFAIQPPIRPETSPNTGETHSSITTAMRKNTIVLRDHGTAVPYVRINTATALSPPSNPARSPAALGSTEPFAATAPAISDPITITPPPTVASEFGSQFITAVAGSAAIVPRIAARQTCGIRRVRVFEDIHHIEHLRI